MSPPVSARHLGQSRRVGCTTCHCLYHAFHQSICDAFYPFHSIRHSHPDLLQAQDTSRPCVSCQTAESKGGWLYCQQVVSVKRLAAYRDDRFATRPNWQKLQELRDEQAASAARRKPRSTKTKHKPRSHEKAAVYAAEAAAAAADGNTSARNVGSNISRSGAANRHRKGSKGGMCSPSVAAGPGAGSIAGSSKEAATRAAQPVGHTRAAAAGKAGLNAQPDKAASGVAAVGRKAALDATAKVARDKERRLQSFAPLTLRKEGPSAATKKRKREAAEAAATPTPAHEGSGLSKEAKKRLKRTAKRAAARAAQVG